MTLLRLSWMTPPALLDDAPPRNAIVGVVVVVVVVVVVYRGGCIGIVVAPDRFHAPTFEI